MSTPTHTSASLLERARNSDELAWRNLVELYGPLVQRWCRQAGLNDDDTADVFQETFRAVSRNLDDYEPRKAVGSFRSWLRSIVRSKTADHFRRRGRQPAARGGTDNRMIVDNVADPLGDDDEEEAESDHGLIVRRAMELIRPDYSERNWKAFWQVAVEGETAVEVAERLGIDPQVVRQANYRIRRRLRAVLKDLVEE